MIVWQREAKYYKSNIGDSVLLALGGKLTAHVLLVGKKRTIFKPSGKADTVIFFLLFLKVRALILFFFRSDWKGVEKRARKKMSVLSSSRVADVAKKMLVWHDIIRRISWHTVFFVCLRLEEFLGNSKALKIFVYY